MNADGLDQAFDNLGKAIKITAGLKGTDKSITEVFKMSGIDEKLEEILWDLLRMDWHINHMAEDLNEKDTADDRQTNVEEAIKELESLIAQQVREARIEMYSLYGEPRCSQLHHPKKDQHPFLEDCPVVDRIKELGE